MILESEVKKKCKKELEKSGWLVVHLIQTNCNGWPDTQIFKNGKTLFIEFKRPAFRKNNRTIKETTSEELQKYRHRKLREAGFEVREVHRLDDIKDLL